MQYRKINEICTVYDAGRFMKNLGELIRSLRKDRKLSQQALAEQYGMSRSTISGIENNTISEIGLRKVEAILNGFGYELAAVPRQSKRPTLDHLKKVNFHG
jgi:HTH-type transcriptional regulator/antitoxin HipB